MLQVMWLQKMQTNLLALYPVVLWQPRRFAANVGSNQLQTYTAGFAKRCCSVGDSLALYPVVLCQWSCFVSAWCCRLLLLRVLIKVALVQHVLIPGK
jgi:hypothetical protein